jgi:hypothetical protein
MPSRPSQETICECTAGRETVSQAGGRAGGQAGQAARQAGGNVKVDSLPVSALHVAAPQQRT